MYDGLGRYALRPAVPRRRHDENSMYVRFKGASQILAQSVEEA
jgi:hypothetical protein